ncbi:MAG: methionyl-tRNA formyltransferase [Treponema sp.]|nr:methionyl-tRNA formyltransferase [Treponema sp.]
MVKVLYAGSPEAAAVTLQKLIEFASDPNSPFYNKYEIAGVLTNPPTAKGRKKELTPTPVGQFALDHNLALFTPEHLDQAAREQILPLNADVLVCFAYGHIFGPKFLGLFKNGGMNLHPSMLPKYRGCTPVPAAILNQDPQTAYTVQTIGLEMDQGDILAQKVVDLTGNETAGSLLDCAAREGSELIAGLLAELCDNGKLPQGAKQQGEASYTGVISKEDGLIDWNAQTAQIDAKIRAYTPDPSCYTHMADGLELKILESRRLNADEEAEMRSMMGGDFSARASGTVCAFVKKYGILIKTGDGYLCVTKLQKQQKNAMSYKDFMNGARDFIGSQLK